MISYVVYRCTRNHIHKEQGTQRIYHAFLTRTISKYAKRNEGTESKCDRYKGRSSIYFMIAVVLGIRTGATILLQGRTIVRFLPAVPQ